MCPVHYEHVGEPTCAFRLYASTYVLNRISHWSGSTHCSKLFKKFHNFFKNSIFKKNQTIFQIPNIYLENKNNCWNFEYTCGKSVPYLKFQFCCKHGQLLEFFKIQTFFENSNIFENSNEFLHSNILWKYDNFFKCKQILIFLFFISSIVKKAEYLKLP